MKELDRRAEAFVREAASAEADMVLSRPQRDEIRRRLDGHRSAGATRVRPNAPKRALAGIGVALAFGAPAWAAAALGLAVCLGVTIAVVVAREHTAGPRYSATTRTTEPPPPNDDSRTATPHRGPSQAPPAVTPPPIAFPVASGFVEPSPPPSRHVVTAPAASSAGSQPHESNLGAEAALLESAEKSLRDHDGARALAVLDEYARRFPDGVFLLEAEAARAIATCKTGNSERGKQLAAEFERRWPSTPVLARVLAECQPPRPAP
jgi:hypothetical protein